MEVRVLDPSFAPIDLIESYISLVWIDRHAGYGDFKLKLPINARGVEELKVGNYLSIEESFTLMIIENLEKKTDFELGDFIEVSGRSMIVLLEDKVFVPPNYPQNYIYGDRQISVIMSHIINTVCVHGAFQTNLDIIPQLSQVSPYAVGSTMTLETGIRNVYDLVDELASLEDIGYRAVFDKETRTFQIIILNGTDRSDRVLFSPDHDNIKDLVYLRSNKDYKNVAYIHHKDLPTVEVVYRRNHSNVSGVDRRVLIVDANELENPTSSNLWRFGRRALAKHNYLSALTGEAVSDSLVYGRDYFLSDRFRVSDGLGNTDYVRAVEYTWTSDKNGVKSYPTLRNLED